MWCFFFSFKAKHRELDTLKGEIKVRKDTLRYLDEQEADFRRREEDMKIRLDELKQELAKQKERRYVQSIPVNILISFIIDGCSNDRRAVWITLKSILSFKDAGYRLLPWFRVSLVARTVVVILTLLIEGVLRGRLS